MEILAPLGLLETARALVLFMFALVLPGWLFLRLDHWLGLTEHIKARDGEPLFSGVVETLCASVFFSIVICSLAFIALTFTIGLNFWTALLFVAAINAILGYFAWKEGR
jgi:hypothetical protein